MMLEILGRFVATNKKEVQVEKGKKKKEKKYKHKHKKKKKKKKKKQWRHKTPDLPAGASLQSSGYVFEDHQQNALASIQ